MTSTDIPLARTRRPVRKASGFLYLSQRGRVIRLKIRSCRAGRKSFRRASAGDLVFVAVRDRLRFKRYANLRRGIGRLAATVYTPLKTAIGVWSVITRVR